VTGGHLRIRAIAISDADWPIALCGIMLRRPHCCDCQLDIGNPPCGVEQLTLEVFVDASR
jgi:hypothetical protein